MKTLKIASIFSALLLIVALSSCAPGVGVSAGYGPSYYGGGYGYGPGYYGGYYRPGPVVVAPPRVAYRPRPYYRPYSNFRSNSPRPNYSYRGNSFGGGGRMRGPR